MSVTVGFYGNKLYNLENLQVSDINILDIGWALSNNLRFNGHSRFPYSVAEHCVAVSLVVPGHLRLAGFLHDAAEAFIGDIVTPVKNNFPEIAVLEDRLIAVIFERYGCDIRLMEEINYWDKMMGYTEASQIMGNPDWAQVAAPFLDFEIKESPSHRHRLFTYLKRFSELTGEVPDLSDPRLYAHGGNPSTSKDLS